MVLNMHEYLSNGLSVFRFILKHINFTIYLWEMLENNSKIMHPESVKFDGRMALSGGRI